MMFAPCNPMSGQTCKSTKETEAWLKGKSLYFLFNKTTFASNKFGAQSFSRKLYLDFMMMKSDVATSDFYEITMNEVVTNDHYLFGRSTTMTYPTIAFYKQDRLEFVPRFSNSVIFFLSHNLLTTSRTVYSFTDWMNEVGGFQAWIHLFVSFVLPFFQAWTLEKSLIKMLFKRSSKQTQRTRRDITNLSYDQLTIQDALASVRHRETLSPPVETPFGAWIKALLAKCIKSLRTDRTLLEQAQQGLERELDVKQMIRQSRMVRNALMFLTTKRERRLIRMQSRLNVLVPRDERTADDSSDFKSDDHEAYLKELLERDQAQTLRLTDRERQLLVGIKNYSRDAV